MDLKQLEYFVTIANAGSISEAARQLHLSQPPLSYQMKQLEAELGTALFVRGSRKITLTAPGKILYERAMHLLDYSASTEREIRNTEKRRILRLGITSSTASVILPVLTRLSALDPEIRYEIQDGNTYTLLDQLRQQAIAAAIIRTPADFSRLASAKIRREGMIAAWTAKDAAVSPNDSISLARLANRPLLLYRRYYEMIMSAFRLQNLEPDIFCLCDDARDVLQWAQAGFGTVILPESMRPLCHGLTVRKINAAGLATDVMFVWQQESAQAAPLSQLCTLLKQDQQQ